MKLSASEARRRFAASRVARLATADTESVPHLVPITFAVQQDLILFAVDHKPKRSADLRRLRNIAVNPAVAVLADEYRDDWSQLWWARADGEAEVWTAGPRRSDAVRLLQEKYDQYIPSPPDGPVVAIRVTGWSGWAYGG